MNIKGILLLPRCNILDFSTNLIIFELDDDIPAILVILGLMEVRDLRPLMSILFNDAHWGSLGISLFLF